MILLIDNYDSFSYNLVHMIGEICLEQIRDKNEDTLDCQVEQMIQVVRNDEITIEEIQAMNPSHIILSPGPGRPEDAGICEEVIREFKDSKKILGVCLGHQAICQVFGATITYASKLMHGKQSEVSIDQGCSIFQGLRDHEIVGRYHSLAADKSTIPDELKVVAADENGEVMAVKHKKYEIYGLQFHPESILTPKGKIMLRNYLIA